MNKVGGWLLFCSSAFAMDKLDERYQVCYGSKEAPVQIVEYLSLSCAKCHELYETEFEGIKRDLIESGEVCWRFHPDPADLPTLQAMACMELLSEEEKRFFWEAILPQIAKWSPKHSAEVMQAAMQQLGKPLPDLHSMEFLEKTDAFVSAYQFLTQKDVVTVLPTLEIDGTIYDETPSREFIDEQLKRSK